MANWYRAVGNIREKDLFVPELLAQYGLEEITTLKQVEDDGEIFRTVQWIDRTEWIGDESSGYAYTGWIAICISPRGNVMEWKRWNDDFARLIDERYGYEVVDMNQFFDVMELRDLEAELAEVYARADGRMSMESLRLGVAAEIDPSDIEGTVDVYSA